MSDYIPSSAQVQTLGLRRSLSASFYIAVALPGGVLVRVSRRICAVVRWSYPRADQIQGIPPRRIPGVLDPAQVEAVIAALRVAIVREARSIPSLTEPRDDSDWSGGSNEEEEEEGGHPHDQHIWYPLIQSLEVGDTRLFFVSCPMESVPPRIDDPPVARPQSLSRHANPWILNTGAEAFAGPRELTNEITRAWVMKLKITTKLVCLCKQQLHEQNWDLFEELEEECFAVVAEQSLELILDVACSFSDARWSDVHISQQLTVFDALVDVLFNIQDLRFNRADEVAGIIIKMVNAFKGVIQRTSNDIPSGKESAIHPATFVVIQVLEFFCCNRDQHIWYPLIQSLEVGDTRLFFVSCPMESVPPRIDDPPVARPQSLSRHANPWILNTGAEAFAGPCELTNEITRTWVMKLKITTKLVCLCKQQLHEQNWDLFEELEEECFAVVAEQSLELILDVACSFSDARWSDVHISQQLTVFDALVDVLFNIQDLRYNRADEVAGIIIKMVNAFKGVIQRTSNDIPSSKESAIHPATFVVIQVLEFFCRNRDMVQSILESGDYNTGPCSDIFNCFVSKLTEDAEIIFQEKGQKYMFVLNNIHYVLQKNCPPGLLPTSIVSRLDTLIDQYIMRYLNEYWFPLMLSYLEGDSLKRPRRSSLKKFIEEFFSICGSQMTWKVQTVLKGILREEIVDLIVPKYMILKALQERPSWLKGTWLARYEKPMYTGPQLKLVVRGLFER